MDQNLKSAPQTPETQEQKKITIDPSKIVLWVAGILAALALISTGIYIYIISFVYVASPIVPSPTPTAARMPLTPTPTPSVASTAQPTPTIAAVDLVNNLTADDGIPAKPFAPPAITNPNDWKTYISSRLHYQIRVPASFDVTQFESIPDASTNDENASIKIGTNPNAFQSCTDGASLQLNYPIPIAPPHVDGYGQSLEHGFHGLLVSSPPEVQSYGNYTIVVNGYPTLVSYTVGNDAVDDNNPCGVTTYTYYLDMKNNTILSIIVSYKNNQTQYAQVMQQIIASLSFQ